MARRWMQVLGLGNESTSNYTSPTGDDGEDRASDNRSEPAVGQSDQELSLLEKATTDGNTASRGEMSVGRRLGSFLKAESSSHDTSSDGKETDGGRRSSYEIVSLVKKKMSIFLAISKPGGSDEESRTGLEAAGLQEPEMDLPTLHYNVERRRPRSKQVASKTTTKARKTGAAIQSQHQVHMLSTLQLISITFFAVSGVHFLYIVIKKACSEVYEYVFFFNGLVPTTIITPKNQGPYGFEPTVGAGGAGLMLVGLVLVPVLWAIPLAWMTAELSSMIPESGGHVLWVYRAFGPFWSFLNSCFAFTCSILDNALYPVLFVDYLGALIYEGHKNISAGWSIFIKIFILFIVTIINILGVDVVGIVSVFLGVSVLAPFITMCLIGLGHLNFDWLGPEMETPSSSSQPIPVDWGKFLTLLLWNTSGFDSAGTCAAEVRNPGHAFPKALSISVGLMVAVYALPTIIGISVLPDSRQWKEGTYIIVAKLIGGNILKGWMGFSAASSALGLLLARLCTNSRILYGMALVEQVPPIFSKLHPKYATPWAAILATSISTLLMTGFHFYSLAQADMLFYAFSTILKFASLVQLRYAEPDAFRPYRVPLSDGALAAGVVLPIGSCIAMLWLSSERAHGIGIVGASLAVLLFIVKELYAQYGTQAEKAVQDRMAGVQQNLDSMQKRIDRVIQEEFTNPVRSLGDTLGDAIHSGVSSGLRSGPVRSLGHAFRHSYRGSSDGD